VVRRCDIETARMRRLWPALDRSAIGKKEKDLQPQASGRLYFNILWQSGKMTSSMA